MITTTEASSFWTKHKVEWHYISLFEGVGRAHYLVDHHHEKNFF